MEREAVERHEQVAVIVAKFFSERRDTSPYASADTMRSLDSAIRNGLADRVARAAAAWRLVYQEQSRVVGTPTRDNPLPDPAEMALLRDYKRIADSLSERVSRIHALAAPANDRVYHRIRDNDQLLELLIVQDYTITMIADRLDRLADSLTALSAAELRPAFAEQLAQLDAAVKERTQMLSSIPVSY